MRTNFRAKLERVQHGERRPFPTIQLKARTPIDITNAQTEEAILGSFSRRLLESTRTTKSVDRATPVN